MLAKWKSSEHVSYKPVVTGLQPTKRWYSYNGFEIISSIFEACKAKMGQIYSLQRYLHGPFIYQGLNLIRQVSDKVKVNYFRQIYFYS